MTRLIAFCLLAPLLLGSAAPPVLQAPSPGNCEVCLEGDQIVGAVRLPLTLPPPDNLVTFGSAQPAFAPVAAATPATPAPATAEAPARPLVRLVVSLPQQKIYVFKRDTLVATSTVSTGRRGHETPAGTFPILQKKVHHRSSTYDNAPMPYMQRLTWSGIALHAGHVTGRPASHGCIRLPWSFAKKLYGLTSFASTVTITHRDPGSVDEALRLADASRT